MFYLCVFCDCFILYLTCVRFDLVKSLELSPETVKVIIIKHGTVTASDMLMHHMSFILTLTFIQGHTDLNHEILNV